MKPPLLPAAALLALALLPQCQKTDPDPASQLPPATQTGANTFGCLLNGQPWTPQGNNSYPNYSVYYDYNYHDGTLDIRTYRIYENGKYEQDIGFASDSVRQPGTYRIKQSGRVGCSFIDFRSGCQYYSKDVGTYCKGQFTITRLDRGAGIVSGTFAFTLYKPGCDSVRITAGRFDRKL